MNIYEKLSNIQQELKCNKGQYNSFGGFHYRSCEDILEAVKPLLKEQKLLLKLDDEICYVGDRYYIRATAKIIDIEKPMIEDDEIGAENCIVNKAYAREEENKKGMDGSQITGASSSYARKYALNGLFLIDDIKDADTDEYSNETTDIVYATANQLRIINKLSAEQIEKVLKKYNIDDLERLTIKQASELISNMKGSK